MSTQFPPDQWTPTPEPAVESFASRPRPTVGCVVPAYNEGETIASVLDSLLAQTRLPDVVHVVVNNTTDDTAEVASHYAGPHVRGHSDDQQLTSIYVHDIGENPDKKVGALNYGFSLVEGMDYMLGVDGDTTADPRAIEFLVEEMASDDRIGGISAIYSIDDTGLDGVLAKFLIAGQRAQFAAFNLQNLLRGRNMAVLGGQYSIFSVAALHEVVRDTHQRSPWVRDSEIEDSLLSLQIKSAGYLTKISARARANVGGMTTLRALDAQQVKWNNGAIDLMWPGQRGDTKGQPFHPNLRLRWFENISMAINGFTRLAFFFLLSASLLFHAFLFSPLWLLPPLAAVLLNARVAHQMASRTRRDYWFALMIVPAELYMWIRLGHFARSWAKFFGRSQTDNWALQARAESGGETSLLPAHVLPVLLLALTVAGAVAGWSQLDSSMKSDSLVVGWTTLGVVTLLQTAWMSLKVFRPYRGFRV
ncbi:glycosyl transferase [Aeromicrobium sp. Root495]|uniref:glycosyltransferase family 2 protein n=1 Tax=Aeromicrobium sp. Root495 TaxID=1736550 RepID=UPI0006FA9400|nr:glycosyltransferase family 2 protein [Aeromicrobium sp. Root495]KQY60196.1 glycosyl transferase [Aeromicrobium sp. Root495]